MTCAARLPRFCITNDEPGVDYGGCPKEITTAFCLSEHMISRVTTRTSPPRPPLSIRVLLPVSHFFRFELASMHVRNQKSNLQTRFLPRFRPHSLHVYCVPHSSPRVLTSITQPAYPLSRHSQPTLTCSRDPCDPHTLRTRTYARSAAPG